MLHRHKKLIQKLKCSIITSIITIGLWGVCSEGFAQIDPEINKVNDIRFAPHPLYSRVVFELDKNVHYRIIPNFKKGIISILFENSILSQKIKTKIMSDRRISDINMSETPDGKVRFDIKVNFTKNTFFHMPMENPPRVVFDIKNKTQMVFKERKFKFAEVAKKARAELEAEKRAEDEALKAAEETIKREKEKVAIEENRKKLAKESEIIITRRLDDGREDFLKALKTYQAKEEEKEKDYVKAKEELSAFLDKFPKSKYQKDAAFLIAESKYKILTADPKNLKLQPVIDTFERTSGMFTDTKYEDMALFRMAEVYNKMGLRMESKAHLKIIMNKFPEGRYALRARLRRAQILLDEKDFEFAYKELLKIVKKDPDSQEARDATFGIAKFYFSNKDYEKSIKIYNDAVEKWPSYAQFHPEVIHNIGENYFMLGNKEKAKSNFFKLVNLYPDYELTPKSLNRIGEIYRMAQNNEASAKVFQETLVRKPDSKEADYSLVRIADLGIVNPSMRFNNLIFNYDSFYDPVKTYKEVSAKYPKTNLAQMAMLREGITLAKEKSFTAAIHKYRELLAAFPETEIKEDVYALIRESFYNLVDTYYDQNGYLPVIATYHRNLRPFLIEIDNPKTLFRIGESYQAIGLNDLALVNYKKVKKHDKKGVLQEPLMVKTAQMLFAKKEYKKAEESMRKFIKRFGKSKHVKDAMQVLADSLYEQRKYAKAVTAYTRLLKRFPKDRNASKAYYFLADSYYLQKKYSAALKRFKHSIQIYSPAIGEKDIPSYLVDSDFKVGECYFKIKNYSKAVQMYKKAIEKNPDDSRVSLAQYIIAKSYNVLKKGENAKASLKEIEEKPQNEILKRVAQAEINLLDWEKKYSEFLK
mgnify:CR=1 FL=1|tara:strand:- start:5436 stop:8045 length:2610 start_codon:yes stop_codon:yes gene_type:complete